MKIKILGCSHSWTERYSSCYLINHNILMDCGADAYKAYIKTKKPFTDIELILVSHFHADHIAGLNCFLTYYQRRPELAKNKKVKIVGPKGIRNACYSVFEFSNLFSANLDELFEFVELNEGESFVFDEITITGYYLKHGDIDNMGYIFTTNGFNFGYTGDTTNHSQLYNFIDKCDMCFVDVARLQTSYSHLGVDDFEKILNQYPTKQIYATHCDQEVYDMPHLNNNMARENDEFEVGILEDC